MNDEPDNSRPSSSSSAILALVVALPLLYVLSIGPAAYLMSKFRAGQGVEDAASAVYAPILWLHEHTPMKQPIESYIDWWERLARRR
ncbi:hypothetical protein [Prosthecobacter sp.]|uniref:hypothetical protein n=1 Tax=Prosthecobacter sp. TaxID=1965333 RepID=UPI003782F4B9